MKLSSLINKIWKGLWWINPFVEAPADLERLKARMIQLEFFHKEVMKSLAECREAWVKGDWIEYDLTRHRYMIADRRYIKESRK